MSHYPPNHFCLNSVLTICTTNWSFSSKYFSNKRLGPVTYFFSIILGLMSSYPSLSGFRSKICFKVKNWFYLFASKCIKWWMPKWLLTPLTWEQFDEFKIFLWTITFSLENYIYWIGKILISFSLFHFRFAILRDVSKALVKRES